MARTQAQDMHPPPGVILCNAPVARHSSMTAPGRPHHPGQMQLHGGTPQRVPALRTRAGLSSLQPNRTRLPVHNEGQGDDVTPCLSSSNVSGGSDVGIGGGGGSRDCRLSAQRCKCTCLVHYLQRLGSVLVKQDVEAAG